MGRHPRLAHGVSSRLSARAPVTRRSAPPCCSKPTWTTPEARDPRAGFLPSRRQTLVEVVEDALPTTWWHALAIGDFRPTTYRLLTKDTGFEYAQRIDLGHDLVRPAATAVRVGRPDRHGCSRQPPPQGLRLRHLVNEILRLARAQATAAVAVQTRSTNVPAQSLYQSLGFAPVETATLFRPPGGVT